MLIVREVLGNLETDPDLAREAADWAKSGRVERVALDIWQAQKARLRVRADGGAELGLDLPRGTVLRSGDVVHREPTGRHLVVVEVQDREVLAVRLLPQPAEAMLATALKLGHLLGNQHWPVRLVGQTAYVPVLIDKNVMRTVLETHALVGVAYAFEPSPPGVELPLIFPSLEDHAHVHFHGEHSHSDGAADDAGGRP